MKNKFNIKLIICGNPRVGKTSLRRSFLGESFTKNYIPTIGADFSQKKVEMTHFVAEVSIWDLAGQPEFKAITKKFFQESHSAIVVFDVTDNNSLISLNQWLDRIDTYKYLDNPSILIIGNKMDLISVQDRDQVISNLSKDLNAIIVKYRGKLEISYEFTSALTGFNVAKAFSTQIIQTIPKILREFDYDINEDIEKDIQLWKFSQEYYLGKFTRCDHCEVKYEIRNDIADSECRYCGKKIDQSNMEDIYYFRE